MNGPARRRQQAANADDDRGGAVVQLPIMASTYVLFIMLLVLVGRVNSGHSTAEAAARYAARTIAIARNPTAAVDVARDQAETTVNAGSAKCRSMDFTHTIHATEVTVTITCQVDLAEVNIMGIPGAWAATATATEPVDQHRENSNEFGTSEASGSSNRRAGVGR